MKNADKLLAISAFIVSICALVVSIYQTQILSQEKDASVWPYLRVEQSWGSNYYILSVNNKGVGPAIIQNMYYQYEDSTFQYINNLAEYIIRQEYSTDMSISYDYTNIEPKGTAMIAGESKDILRFRDTPGINERMLKYLQKVDIFLDYSSIYNNCWRNDNNEVINLQID